MRGPVAELAEVARCRDDPRPEHPLPDAIDVYAGRLRVVTAAEILRQFQSSAALALADVVVTGEDFQKTVRDRRADVVDVSADIEAVVDGRQMPFIERVDRARK